MRKCYDQEVEELRNIIDDDSFVIRVTENNVVVNPEVKN